jgi:hypothetical protein
MSRQSWSMYALDTGLFTGRRVSGCTPDDLVRNTPPGCAAIEGKFDAGSQRVDLQTGEVVDYRPDPPDADHEWNDAARRWTLRPEIAAARRARVNAIAQIESLEARQARPMRELALNPDNARAADVLAEIESQISVLRSQL